MNIEIEVYKENGKEYVWIGSYTGSGCTYELGGPEGKTVGEIIKYYFETYYTVD